MMTNRKKPNRRDTTMTIKNIETMANNLWHAKNFILEVAHSPGDPKVKEQAMRANKVLCECLSILWDEPNYWEWAGNIS